MQDRIQIRNLYKVFGESPRQIVARLRTGIGKDEILRQTGHVVGLDDVSLSIPTGDIYMVMGLSGSGKSTLARCINRIVEPDAGQVLLDGEDLTAAGPDRLRQIRRTRISMVFQNFALLPNKTVIDNVAFGLKLRGVPARERLARAGETLEVVGLSAWADRRPDALSGGMRQRVGLARALCTEADVLIMDEAFSALDPLIRGEMQDELLRLQTMLHKTVLFITHDFQEALRLGSRIAIMADGKVIREGTPQEIVRDPGSDYVAAFTRHVDRARLFDARSVMVEDPPGASPFALDAEGRPVGYRAGAGGGEVARVAPDTKLIDIAALCGTEREIAVTDEAGRMIGRIERGRLLVAIAGRAGHETSGGATHA